MPLEEDAAVSGGAAVSAMTRLRAPPLRRLDAVGGSGAEAAVGGSGSGSVLLKTRFRTPPLGAILGALKRVRT